MKRLTVLFLFSYISLINCGGGPSQDLSGLLLLLGTGGPANSFHCGQTVANPIPHSTNTNTAVGDPVDFINAAGGNNCGAAALVDNDDGTVTDTENHLLWTLCTAYKSGLTIFLYDYVSSDCNVGGVAGAPDKDITQSEAVVFCESLTFAGHSNWILPDAIQLDTLYTTSNPFSLSPFGIKESLKRLGVIWTSTQTTDRIIHTYTSGTLTTRFVAVGEAAGQASLICVAKI
ncbi:DUF1566 domain-containing protein [Leptospira wolffii]|uniref:Lcl domain-containing protein n=1 Tax=Leptospira wolffii TaxID=409998 RepID=UPI0010828A7B|nr:DUF1566 domain-containing protein [Leptospira wolffii]TGK56985.1 DUF1566 domain-containing protein [Leptospira wolffii]TGK71018.1 DUF1566 domain-containing protein [Leptospira wolffii]TGK75709.1 DUF1566 domain-containing protein [Leptospira wolffii]TGL32757.1 DUF1566 domain-containing protein [Leptospira wolffii]